MNNLIGQHLGPYRILEQIGTGGMATVYKAYQPAMERDVAIKVIAAHFAQEEEFRKRFRREAKSVAQLEHAHILPVHDYGEAEGRPYLVMRFLEAGTLKDKMAAGPLPLTEVNRIVGQVGSALDYAHRMGVIHRDVKPANVLLDAEGDAFLTDFGVAKMLMATSQLTGTGVGIGTPAYMSPEQAQAKKVDARSDVYSLGVMLYEMVTGRVPFDAETPLAVALKHISDPLPLPSSVRPEVPERVERVILRAMAKEPEDRYQTAGEMVRALDGAVRAAQAAARTEPAIERTTPMPGVVRAAPRAPARKLRLPRWVGWAAGGAVALAAFFLVLSRVPLRVQISGGQLEVVRVVEETAAATVTPTPQPTAIPAHTPGPTTVTPAATAPIGSIVYEDGRTGSAEIYVANSDGSNERRLTDDPAGDWCPTWSPDGTRIVFDSNRDAGGEDRNQIYVMDADGSNQTRLTQTKHNEEHPSWSPDGSRIAFHSGCGVAVINADGSNWTRLVAARDDLCVGFPTWSPDSHRIAFRSLILSEDMGLWQHDIYVVNDDGSGLLKLATFTSEERGRYVVWSPDGGRVAFDVILDEQQKHYAVNSDGSGEPEEIHSIPDSWYPWYWPQWAGETTAAPSIKPTDQRGRLVNCGDDLCILASGGSSVSLGLATSYTQFHGYTWSPDGSQIAFSACLLGGQGKCEELYVADLDNGAVVRLPRQGESHHPLVPAWSPNGEWIAYHDSGALSVVRPDGTGHREIVPHPYCPTNIAWSPDSQRLAWFARWCDEDETSPALLLVVNFDGSDRWLLWTRDDANPDVAFSPDGTYLAVRFDDGSVYRVNPECDPGPEGCDESSRTEMDDFPEHWLHSYWPQWDGEAAAAPTPIPGSSADQARAFAEPILAAIADRAPDYENDFDHSSADWPSGPGISGHSSHVEGEMGFEAGEYFVTAGAQGHEQWACYGGDSLISFPADFVLDITGRMVPSTDPNGDGDWQIQFRKWEFGGFYVLIVSQGGVGLVRHGPGEGDEDDLSNEPAPFGDISEANRFQIIARGSETAVYVNGAPFLYVNDSGYSDQYGAGTINLGVCNLSEAPLQARWDNLRIWDISDLELPSAEATPAPTGDATFYGCQPGEKLLYLNDFEGGEQSFGPWVAEEAPEGGLALHALGQGMLSLLSESAPVAERIAFRLRPGGGEWIIEFRVQREPRYAYYLLSGFVDQLRLDMQVEDAQSLLASAGPLIPNRWALVEIVWEDRYTLAVRVDGAEVMRYTLPEDWLLESGGVNLFLPRASDEAWFDDIVACGE